jgi:2-keto-4-pentenoate hydratase
VTRVRQLERAITTAADRLETAARQGVPCRPVRDLLPDGDARAAYAVQRELVRRRRAAGATVVGRKIGLTSPAVQRQLGVDQPDYGVLFADMDVSAKSASSVGDVTGRAATVPGERLLQPKAEAEIAFVLAADLLGDDPDEVRRAVGYAVAALEIVDSRVAGWDITITDTVADNASSGLFVLSERRLPLADFEPRKVEMRLYADGELVSEGTGAACLGDPLTALGWLACTARDLGDPLRAGQVVLSGALGPMVATPPGTALRAEITGLGEVSARVTATPFSNPVTNRPMEAG